MSLAVDSTRNVRGDDVMRFVDRGWTAGTVEFTDTLIEIYPDSSPPDSSTRVGDSLGLPFSMHQEAVLANVNGFDFTKRLWRQLACFNEGPTPVTVSGSSRVHLWFGFPNGDCGFGASGDVHTDSIVGRWGEVSGYAGLTTSGRFRMKRVKLP